MARGSSERQVRPVQQPAGRAASSAKVPDPRVRQLTTGTGYLATGRTQAALAHVDRPIESVIARISGVVPGAGIRPPQNW